MMFIALEGIDGCGKSVQHKLLVERLDRALPTTNIVGTSDPCGSPLALIVRNLITTTNISDVSTLLLIGAARADNYRLCIKPALDRGDIVVTDRWLMSSLVYQNGLEELAWQAHHHGCAALLPDVTFVIDLTVEEAQRRLHERGNLDVMENIPRDVAEQRRDSFLEHAWEMNCHVINGMEDIRTVHSNIWGVVKQTLDREVHNANVIM